MKVFGIKFSGVWPVGAAAVVVADDQAQAIELLRSAWATRYPRLVLTREEVDVSEISTDVVGVNILCDGDVLAHGH